MLKAYSTGFGGSYSAAQLKCVVRDSVEGSSAESLNIPQLSIFVDLGM